MHCLALEPNRESATVLFENTLLSPGVKLAIDKLALANLRANIELYH